MQKEKQRFSGYTQAVLAAVITFTCGMSYGAYGMLIVPLSERLGCSITAAGVPATVETIAAFVAGIVGAGALIEKWSARRCILLGAIIASLFVTSYAFMPSLFLLCVWEAITGASMAFGYSTGMSAFIKEWFVERRETVLGAAIACIGFGAAAGTWLFGKIDTTYGLNVTCIVFGALGVLSILIYVLGLRNPDQLGQKPLGWEKATALAAEEGSGATTDFGVDFHEALRSPSLYLICGSCLLWALSMVLSPYLATILMTNGIEEMAAANYATINNIAMAVMSLVVGALTSKLGPKSYVIAAFGAGILGLAVLGVWLEMANTTVILLLASILMGCGYVVGTTYGPMVTTKVFGNKCFDRIIPIVFGMRCIGLGVGVMILPTLATNRGSWTLSIVLAIIMMAAAIVMGLLAMRFAPMNRLHHGDDDNAAHKAEQ